MSRNLRQLNAVKQNIPPVLSYSCRNWDYHLSGVASTDSDAVRRTLLDFLELHVLFWIVVELPGKDRLSSL